MKKKVTLIALAMLCVVASGWAKISKEVSLPKRVQESLVEMQKTAGKHQPMLNMQRQTDEVRQQGMRVVDDIHLKLSGERVAPRRSAKFLAAPTGNQISYSRSCVSYYPTMFGLYYSEEVGLVGNVIFGEDNKVYFKNLVSKAQSISWIEGSLEGKTIKIDFPQEAEVPNSGYEFLMVKMVLVTEGDQSYYVVAEDQTVTFDYDANTGAISSQNDMKQGMEAIGLIYAGDHSWSGYADTNIKYEYMSDPLVEVPEGLTTELYALQAKDYEGSLVNVAFDGNDVYVQGIDANIPDTWIKGIVQGDKVRFATGQYIGPDEEAGYHQYLVSVNAKEEYNSRYGYYYYSYELTDADIEFTYDAVTKTFSNSSAFLINCGTETVYYMSSFIGANLIPFVEKAATPAAPVVNYITEGGWEYYRRNFGWGYIDFDVKCQDVDGNYILPDKLSYAVWIRVNGEEKQLTTSKLDYVKQKAETMSEFPYGYTDACDVYCTGVNSSFYYHVIGPEAFGIQTIYRGEGQENKSEVVWESVYSLGADVQPEAAKPVYPEATINEADKAIAFSYYKNSGEVLGSLTNYCKPETYDVAIKIDNPAVVGNYIKSITFPLQEVEGVSDIQVFLTSQLRLEGGKNVADLAVKSVTPTEAGFITVALDKPYLVPEEGVYVGYSLTINDLSSDLNKYPIAACNVPAQGGFYLHTSDGFLKWLDVSAGLGASSLLSVEIVGSSVKGDALAVADGDSKYVKTGEAFTLPLVLWNQGGNGVQSAVLSYEVAGQSGTQEVNLHLTNILGTSTQVVLNLPAIAHAGNYDLKVKAIKVNGKDNEAIGEATVPVIVLNTVPQKRTLLEEYTGLWCGYCPRGYVGLEKLAELYPDDYVLVSYHNSDEMEIISSDSYPSYVESFPAAWMDRDVSLDAYYGTGKKEFGIADDMAARNKEFGVSDLSPEAVLSAEGIVDITTTVTFPYDLKEANYAVEYILTADGLQNEAWSQSNNYAEGAMDYPLYMEQFTNGEEYVKGLVFNDVAVLTSEILGGSNNGIYAAEADKPVELSYKFKVAHAVNLEGEPVIQDLSKLKVVALLVDKNTGVVLNANKTKVTAATGISQMEQKQNECTIAYDLLGRRVSQPAKGLYLVNGRKEVLK